MSLTWKQTTQSERKWTMNRLLIIAAAVAFGMTAATAAQAKGPGGSSSKGGSKPSGGFQHSSLHTSNSHTSKSHTGNFQTLKKDFHKGNPRFHGKDYFKNFTYR